jgi:hypothetical protein
MRGFGNRPTLWDLATEVQHEVMQGMSVTFGYYRNWHGNHNVTNNLEVTPADYDPYCIPAPIDSRLPEGGGYQVCGLYDVVPEKFGRVNNLIAKASDYGDRQQYNDFFSFGFTARPRAEMQFGGGVDTGRTVNDTCFVVDSPQELLNCRVESPFGASTQVKLYGSYPLPAEFRVSGTYQNTSGRENLANYPAPNALIQPSLGRPLAAGVRATATVPLVVPQTMFESRRNQLDLRVTKLLRFSTKLRLEVSVDVYNVFNASDVNIANSVYGPTWLMPLNDAYSGGAILTGRLVEFGGRLTF